MSQVKDDMLKQALQQVKVLKARLESFEQTDPSLLQSAYDQVESLRREVGIAETANKKLHVSLKELEEFREKAEQAEQSKARRLDEALRQVQNLRSEVESLKAENTTLKQQRGNDKAIARDSHSSPIQLSINLSSQAPKDYRTASNQPLVREEPASATEISLFPTLLSPAEKVALFGDLFAWRKDIFAERWESRLPGKSGYSPARQHYEFHGKKSCPGPPACPNLSLTDVLLKKHLQGKATVGVYPMLENEMCRFVAIDLDQKNKRKITKCDKVKEPWSEHVPPPKRELETPAEQLSNSDAIDESWSWKEDARALMNAARTLNVPAYLERSRSGMGGHVWIFFEEQVTAAVARRLAEALLTRAERDTGLLRLRSYDRMFPNQDTMPQKGYGNLIALPLQKGPLSSGNSTFLDESMSPYPDQWALLQSVRKMSALAVEAFVMQAARQNALMPVDRPSEKEEADEKVDPWALPP